MNIESFVSKEFGEDELAYLKKIRTGGDNNSKGGQYELYFAVAKICEIAANEADHNDFEISRQEYGFVDDLTVRCLSKAKKKNYQLKNSSNSAANWDDDVNFRFDLQHRIDSNFYQCPDNKQVLVVSCPKKDKANQLKIPSNLKGIGFSEFFPYKLNLFEQINETENLKNNFKEICDSTELQVADYAFRLILAALISNSSRMSVAGILESANRMGRPGIFRMSADQDTIPEWLDQKCRAFQDVTVSVESGHFIVNYNNLRVTIGKDISEPSIQVLDGLTTLREFIHYLMSTAISEL